MGVALVEGLEPQRDRPRLGSVDVVVVEVGVVDVGVGVVEVVA